MHRHRDITSPSRPPPSAESSVDKTSSDLALKNIKKKKKWKNEKKKKNSMEWSHVKFLNFKIPISSNWEIITTITANRYPIGSCRKEESVKGSCANIFQYLPFPLAFLFHPILKRSAARIWIKMNKWKNTRK